MFDITSDDIARLTDENLRVLVARLCEAELRRRGLSTAFVTWGGSQTATDGGIDIRVALPPNTEIGGFIPRSHTGIQVKKEDLPPAKIRAEMRPQGVLRPAIQELIARAGAYIIVSADGSTSDTALRNRRTAMKEALSDVPNCESFSIDFYDRNRMASWVRSHEGLIPWALQMCGKPIPGWQSYGAWTASPVDVEYLVDETHRLRAGTHESANLSALEGIQRFRDELRQRRRVVRLVGLSGVGKTRLVQALFDDRIGAHSLDSSLAIYANMSDGPEPNPVALATYLIANRTVAILVVDNCPPDLHQRLSELCRQGQSELSLITVEYDVRDDTPEGTDVFTLDTSSAELVERLLRQRFPLVSQVDARTIADASGGNARIALALADTLGQNETLAGLSGEELFRRLFLQRHEHDEALYRDAQICSLVYSFQGEDVSTSDTAELHRLGAIVGRSAHDLYRSVAEFQRRDLLQRRGEWRAVLPQAIANRFAAVALQNIPLPAIVNSIAVEGSERLLQSFSRRLGYLHKSREAIAIAEGWLAPGGFLHNVENLNDVGKAMLENIAPVAPEATVAALERMLLTSDSDATSGACSSHLDLLRSLAYDANLFERCITVMVKLLSTEDIHKKSHGTQVFSSMFHVILSGVSAGAKIPIIPVEK